MERVVAGTGVIEQPIIGVVEFTYDDLAAKVFTPSFPVEVSNRLFTQAFKNRAGKTKGIITLQFVRIDWPE